MLLLYVEIKNIWVPLQKEKKKRLLTSINITPHDSIITKYVMVDFLSVYMGGQMSVKTRYGT